MESVTIIRVISAVLAVAVFAFLVFRLKRKAPR
jgi:hypothetical protein